MKNPTKNILVKGARVHNLKNIDVTIPRDELVVITGLSGSGKSSLAFDTIYAEGQRRYVESLSSYARQFLQLQDKPDVDLIEGLSPAISIEQKSTSKNPRSTVATVTEIYDYFRLLFARAGTPYCYECQKPISQKSPQAICQEILSFNKERVSILSPLIRQKKGEHKQILANLKKEGFVRVLVDKEVRLLEEDIELNPKTKHDISLVVDRMIIEEEQKARVSDAVELALKKSGGLVVLLRHDAKKDQEMLFSEHFGCIDCNVYFPKIEPRMFSFNAPMGACESCNGLGNFMSFKEEKVILDPKLSLNEGCITPYGANVRGYYYQLILSAAKAYGVDADIPWQDLPQKDKKALLDGAKESVSFVYKSQSSRKTYRFNKRYGGILNELSRRYLDSDSELIKSELEKYMSLENCPACEGARLKKAARHVKIAHYAIHDVTKMSIKEALDFFAKVKFTKNHELIAKPILKEITARLSFLDSVGLEYLTLNRSAKTLSGGEAQRIRLATQIGSALVGVLYVLDEPSIGLHQRDNEKLLSTLKKLRDLGNTVLVVEHDEDTILEADYVIDIGPKAGVHGGEVVFQGKPKDLMTHKTSLTAKYLSRKMTIHVPKKRPLGKKFLTLTGAKGHNLKNVDVKIPLGVMTAVTGVSGSGKSSLIIDTLFKKLASIFGGSNEDPLEHKSLTGLENLDKVIDIDQSPIGRTPRSNPATYTGVFDVVRKLFAQTQEALIRGYDQGRFSFNVKGGRCEKCQGGGVVCIEMNFLPDVYVVCEECQGKRFNKQTLEVKFKDKTIADVLDMSIDEAVHFFSSIPSIHRKLKTIQDVGLGYISLGQQATTLSGGEAQRIKLSKELSKKATKNTLYILDEPTTGLHFHDVDMLLKVLHRLVDQGASVLVIEHNLDVIKSADHVIDLGPEGGLKGGQIIAQGTPQDISRCSNSYTGKFLQTVLKKDESCS